VITDAGIGHSLNAEVDISSVIFAEWQIAWAGVTQRTKQSAFRAEVKTTSRS
jgi:hypothetical protein